MMNVGIIIGISIISFAVLFSAVVGILYYRHQKPRTNKPTIAVLRNDALSVSSIGNLYNNFDSEVTAQILMNTEIPKAAIIISQMKVERALATFEHLSDQFATELLLVLDKDLCEQVYKTAVGKKLKRFSGKRLSQISKSRPLSYEFRSSPDIV